MLFRSGSFVLYKIPAAGGAPVRLTTAAGNQMEPCWSPDGQWIAYLGGALGQGDIYAVPAEGGEPVNLTASPGDEGTPAWSPDGQRIAYHADDGGNLDVWVLDFPPATPTGASSWGGLKARFR